MVQDLRREVTDVETDDRPLSHRDIAAGGGVEPAVVEQADPADGEQPAPDIGVFAVELDRGVEPADAIERLATDREVPAVEDGADPEQMLDQQLGDRREGEVVAANEETSPPVPV